MDAWRQQAPAPVDGVLFPTLDGRLRSATNTGKQLRSALDRLGMDATRSHKLRRTVATLLDVSGQSARAIADQLGHARPSMTQDVYLGRGTPNGAAAANLEIIGQRLSGEQTVSRHPGRMVSWIEDTV